MKAHVICICRIEMDIRGEHGYEMQRNAIQKATELSQDMHRWTVEFVGSAK